MEQFYCCHISSRNILLIDVYIRGKFTDFLVPNMLKTTSSKTNIPQKNWSMIKYCKSKINTWLKFLQWNIETEKSEQSNAHICHSVHVEHSRVNKYLAGQTDESPKVVATGPFSANYADLQILVLLRGTVVGSF